MNPDDSSRALNGRWIGRGSGGGALDGISL